MAAGRQDVYFEMILKPWDYAAGALLVEEAGGTFDMPLCENGADFSRNTMILATNGTCLAGVRGVFDSFRDRL